MSKTPKLLTGKKRKFKIRRCEKFGDWLEFDLPKDADIIIVAVNDGYGLRPIELHLPHQFYKRDIAELFAARPKLKQITIIPARSADYIDLCEKS